MVLYEGGLTVMQLTRMAAFACENQFEKACSAACDLIDEIGLVPVEYLRAIGHPMVSFEVSSPFVIHQTDLSPQLQELVGVGHLLSSFIGRHLSLEQLSHFRTVM